jgi:hypothetical protein
MQERAEYRIRSDLRDIELVNQAMVPSTNLLEPIYPTGYRHITVGPLGSHRDKLIVWQLQGCTLVKTGCFLGTLEIFEKSVRDRHGENIYGKEYSLALTFIRAWLDLEASTEVDEPVPEPSFNGLSGSNLVIRPG